MDANELNNTAADFQRTPGGRRGCGCCGFYLVGLFVLPTVAVVGALLSFLAL